MNARVWIKWGDKKEAEWITHSRESAEAWLATLKSDASLLGITFTSSGIEDVSEKTNLNTAVHPPASPL